jgi:uncharacterized peroxidase-related enzyme
MNKNNIILGAILLTGSTSSFSNDRTHIAVNPEIPGIRALFDFRPETGNIIKKLVGILLRGKSTLAVSDREMIAAYVSWLNQCQWCCNVHSAIASHLPDMSKELVQAVKDDFETAPISEKLKSFLNIASKVQKDARTVSDEDVARAREHGATDLEIHDIVLIASVFCMNNRYVMGLDAWTPQDPAFYDANGKILAQQGYNKN